MRGTPRLPDSRAGTSMHLRVPGSLLQPAASALVARLSVTAGLREPAGRYLTLPPLHETGTTPYLHSAIAALACRFLQMHGLLCQIALLLLPHTPHSCIERTSH